jgi:hypothetical protein
MKETLLKFVVDAAAARKGFMVSDAMKKSDFGVKDAEAMGYSCDASAIQAIMDSNPEYKKAVEQFCADSGLTFSGNIDALGQFFTVINEPTINVLYRGRTAAQTFGVKTMGDWTTERVAFKLRELTGDASLYDDWGRAKLVGYNYGWDVRDTLRLEWALEVTKLEEAVGAVMRRNPYKDKKDALALSQSIWNNEFFWNGFSGGSKKLFGVLTDPNAALRKEDLPLDMTVLTHDVKLVVAMLAQVKQDLATDLQGNGDIDELDIEIACPLSWQAQFTIANDVTGYTANRWLAENWKNAHVSFKPELDKADGGTDGLMIVFARSVPGVGMDTINLMETSKLRLIGAVPTVKGREEAYSSSVAGALVACPLGMKMWTNGTDPA